MTGASVFFISYGLPALLNLFSPPGLPSSGLYSALASARSFFPYPAWLRPLLPQNCRLPWNLSCFQNCVECVFGYVRCQAAISLLNTSPRHNRAFLIMPVILALAIVYLILNLNISLASNHS